MCDKTILKETYARKLVGVEYHRAYRFAFELLGFNGFASLQGERFADELAEAFMVASCYTLKYCELPDGPECCKEHTEYVRALVENDYADCGDAKPRLVAQLFYDWLDWETETVAVLTCNIKKAECPHLQKLLHKLYKGTSSELEELRKLIKVLESNDWSLSFLYGFQHWLIENSKAELCDALDDLSKHLIVCSKYDTAFASPFQTKNSEGSSLGAVTDKRPSVFPVIIKR
jgi:hypothetical protein